MYRLKFTGDCDQEEFERRCAEHDFWYHSYYFDNGFVQRGDYDIGRDVAGYGFPADMTGMSVLDVGTGSGWFATFFEQRGADVTTVDVRGHCDFDEFGWFQNPDLATEKSGPDRILADGRAIYYSPVSRGFWIMKDILGLRAEYVNARAYDLSPALFGGNTFDLVFAGSVLMHLRDPVGGLMAMRRVCHGCLMATSLIPAAPEDESTLLMRLLAPETEPNAWWVPNKRCFEQWFLGAGFSRVDSIRTVTLTIDKPYLGSDGKAVAASHTQHLAEAYV